MGKIINITPHTVVLVDPQSQCSLPLRQHREIKPVRITQEANVETLASYQGVNIPVKVIYLSKAQEALPSAEPGTLYIVSRMVADTFRQTRHDFVFPYDLKRTESGGITGCYSLARFG
jgi:hypothetical protein